MGYLLRRSIMLKKYKGIDVFGKVVRHITDIQSRDAVELWKQDSRVVRITENDKQIWKR